MFNIVNTNTGAASPVATPYLYAITINFKYRKINVNNNFSYLLSRQSNL